MEIILNDADIPVITPDSLVKGDCLDLLSKIIDHSIPLIICDPPYAVTQAKWDILVPFDQLWSHFDRILTSTGTVLIFGCQPFTTAVIQSNPRNFKYCWYWVKEKGTGFLNAKRQPLRTIEEICVFHGKNPTYHPQMIPMKQPIHRVLPNNNSDIYNDHSDGSPTREYTTYTHSYPTNVLEFARENANKSLVPSQKPVNLLKYLIQTHSNPGDTVLDPTMGSGSTGLAAAAVGRQFIGFELNELHFDVAAARISGDATDKLLLQMVKAHKAKYK